jgi:4-hydroxy-tetrahydrodipicolinate synthase
VDHAGYERLIEHYVRAGVTGVIPLGTTGESPTIDEAEAEALVGTRPATVATVRSVGVGGNDTR